MHLERHVRGARGVLVNHVVCHLRGTRGVWLGHDVGGVVVDEVAV